MPNPYRSVVRLFYVHCPHYGFVSTEKKWHSMQIGPSRACFRMVIFSTQNVVKTGISVIIIELRKVDMLNGK